MIVEANLHNYAPKMFELKPEFDHEFSPVIETPYYEIVTDTPDIAPDELVFQNGDVTADLRVLLSKRFHHAVEYCEEKDDFDPEPDFFDEKPKFFRTEKEVKRFWRHTFTHRIELFDLTLIPK